MDDLHLAEAASASDLESISAPRGLPPLSPEQFEADSPDMHLMLRDRYQLVARCSLWWNGIPALKGEKVGFIGHFEAAGESACETLFTAAHKRLRKHDCAVSIGPINGSTWRSYRLVTDRGERPRFFMEPWNPASYPHYFEQAGYWTLSRYRSRIIANLEEDIHESLPRLREDLSTRPFRSYQFHAELRRLYPLITASFASNLMYQDLSEAGFIQQYKALQNVLKPALIRIAEYQNQAVGVALMLPDLLEMERNDTIRTVILKTLAVHPDLQGSGIASRLVQESYRAARKARFRQVIHALMHDDNDSNRFSTAHGTEMRRYALFCTSLLSTTAP